MISSSTKMLQAKLKDSLRDLRMNAGLTQAQLAEKIGIAKKTLQTWEQYGGPVPNFINIVDYITACEAFPAAFFLNLFNRHSSENPGVLHADDLQDFNFEDVIEIYLNSVQKSKLMYMLRPSKDSNIALLLEVVFAFSIINPKSQYLILSMIYMETELSKLPSGLEIDKTLLKSRIDQLYPLSMHSSTSQK